MEPVAVTNRPYLTQAERLVTPRAHPNAVLRLEAETVSCTYFVGLRMKPGSTATIVDLNAALREFEKQVT